MLSSPDTDLCRRDPAIRGLATLLDPGLLKAGAARAGASLPLADFEPTYLRYKPGTNCIVGYSPPGSMRTIAFYGKAYARGSGKPKESPRAIDSSRGRIVLGSDGIELFVFPTDGKLRLLDGQHGEASWSAQSARREDEFAAGSKILIETLAYRPERRGVFAETAEGRGVAVIKAYSPVEFSRTLPRACAIKACGDTLFPALIATDESSRHLKFAWSTGESLQTALEQRCADIPQFVRTGARLAAVHEVRLEALPIRSNEEDADHLTRIAAMIGRVCPGLAEPSARTARRIARQLVKLPAGESTLHGDFGAKQVVSTGESIAFLDFDEAARGNAAADLGNFIARLEADALCGAIQSELVSPVRAALLAGYESSVRLPPERELRVHTAAGLFRVALEPFRRHDPDWPGGIARYLDRVASVLDDAAHSRTEGANEASGLSFR